MILRNLQRYYPIGNALFVIGEALVIYTSVFFACLITLGTAPLKSFPSAAVPTEKEWE